MEAWWGGVGVKSMAVPPASVSRELLNSSRADALPNQPASLSLIFYLASSSDMSSSAHRTHRASTSCQYINQAPLRPACPVYREQSVNRIKLLLSPASREASVEVRAEPRNALTANQALPTARMKCVCICLNLFVCRLKLHSN